MYDLFAWPISELQLPERLTHNIRLRTMEELPSRVGSVLCSSLELAQTQRPGSEQEDYDENYFIT